MLPYGGTDTLSDFIEVLGGDIDGGDVTINIDKDGGSDFTTPDQIIVLTEVGSSTQAVTLDLLDDYNIIFVL